MEMVKESLLGLGAAFVCFVGLFLVLVVALVVWLWRRLRGQQVSDTAPEPPIQATIEHATAASEPSGPDTPAAPSAPGGEPSPSSGSEPSPPTEPPSSPSTDV